MCGTHRDVEIEAGRGRLSATVFVCAGLTLLFAASIRAQDELFAAFAFDEGAAIEAETSFLIESPDGSFQSRTMTANIMRRAAHTANWLAQPGMRYDSLNRLLDDFRVAQQETLPVAPPAPDSVFYAQRASLRVLVPHGFPTRMLDGLVFENYRDLAYVAKITVVEDAVTRERIVYNSLGREIWRQAAPAAYDPWAWLRAHVSWALQEDTAEARELRGIYDPARIRCEYLLLPADSVPYYALADAMADEAEAQALRMALPMPESYAPAAEEFVFTAAPTVSNGIVTLEIHLPDTVTCRVDLFGTPDLLQVPPWTLLATTVTTAGTFRVQTPCLWSNCFFHAGNADVDSDGDGIPDDRESLLIYSTVSGVVHYSGGLSTGAVWVVAVTNSASWETNHAVQLPGPGPYVIPHIPLGTNYYIKAWMDSNSNGVLDAIEARCTPTLRTIVIKDVANKHLTLTIPDTDGDALPDWWEVEQFGSVTNWTGLSDPDGDALHNLMEYWYRTDPLAANTNTAAADAVLAVDTRIAGLNPTNALPLFVNYLSNGTSNVFIRNTNCWAASYDLTCCSPWNSQFGNTRAGTLISPRHVLFVAHGQFYPPTNTVMCFVDRQNNVVSRTLVAVKEHPAYDSYYKYPDLTVGLLDSDVPTNSISFAKVLPDNYASYIHDGRYLPAVRLDQEEKALLGDVTSVNVASPSGTNTHYRATFAVPEDPIRNAFYEDIVGGDSGNPVFVLIKDDPVLLTVWTSPASGTSVTAFTNDINQLMSDLGGGYLLTPISLAGFTSLGQ